MYQHIATPNCCSTEENCSEVSGCCLPHHRRFISKAELKEMLEKYKEQLRKEIEGVDERISKLSKKED
jgi:hypothetical protein